MSTPLTDNLNRNPSLRNFRLSKEQNHLLLDMIVFFKLPWNNTTTFRFSIGSLPDSYKEHWITLEGSRISEHLQGVLDFGVYGDEGKEILNGMRECYIVNRGVEGEYSFFK